jgi:histidine phosphotransferase ChpT
MLETEQMRFIELLCSKLCHDLISPIGAISNGLEFLEQENDRNNNDAFELISKSSNQAGDKLAYYRVAFGTAGSGDLMQFNLVRDMIEKLANEKNIEIEWFGIKDYADLSIGKISGKLLLNIVLLAFDALPRGGHAEVTVLGDDITPNTMISVTGDKCKLHEEVEAVLVSEISTNISNVRNIMAFFCKQLARSNSQTIEFHAKSSNCIVFKTV